MIDEDVLRELLHEAADAAPAPGRAPEALVESLTASAPDEARGRPRRGVLVGAAAAAAVLVVVVAIALGRAPDRQRFDAATGDTGTTVVPSTTVPAPPDAFGSGGATASGSSTGGGDTSTGSGSSGGVIAPAVEPAKVVKTGSLELAVRARAYEATVERITAIAVGLGGYVAESSTSESDAGPSGAITLRVPAGSFEQLVSQVRKLGDVRAVTTKGTDVTAQFTDLAARLTALTATRDRLYEVLRGARNVGDIIAVQDRITGVQTEIEQLQGQQRLLSDQAGFGTLAVTLAEPGADRISTASSRDEGLRHAFAVARHRFADSVEGFIAWTGSAALAVIFGAGLAAVAWLVWRRGRRRFI